MKDQPVKSVPVTDSELLEKAFFYFRDLRPLLPTLRLRDACSGILVFIFDLLNYLVSKGIDDYGNN